MSRKKDQNWSTLVYGTCQYRNWSNGVPGVYSMPQKALLKQELKLLVRDSHSPNERNEKPYVHKHVVIQWPAGVLPVSFNAQGTSFIEWRGTFGPYNWRDGLETNMRYRGPWGEKYIPTTSDWPINPDLLSQAEVKAYASLRNKYHEMDLSSYLTPGIWWGERKETAGLLADAAKGLASLVQGVRSLNYGKVRRALLDFRVDLTENLWTRVKREMDIARKKARRQQGEVLYGLTARDTVFTANRIVLTANLGVAPLLKDLDAAYKATLQSVDDPTNIVIKANGWEQRHDTGSVTNSFERGHVVHTTRVNSLVRYRVTLIASPSDSDLAKFERAGVLNVPSVLGEVTGLSFILNYFYPVLDYLKATSTPAAFTWKDGSWSVKVSHMTDVIIKSSSPLGQHTVTGRYIHREFRRKVLTSFPVPIPPLSLRHDDLSVDQAVNVVTVAIEKVRKALGW